MSNLEEPRYLLDEDSVCYGCGHYESIEDIDPSEDMSDVDIDENGGFCNCRIPCMYGSMHTENGKVDE